MTLAQNRPFVSFAFEGPGGRTRTGKCWLDTGGGALILRRDFAEALRLRETGKAVIENGRRLIPVEAPRVQIGNLSVAATSDAMMLDGDRMMAAVDADVLFPVRLLADHSVTFDYPSQRVGIDVAAVSGTESRIYIAPRTSFVRVRVSIAGETMHMLLDTGASCTMLSQRVIDRLRSDHPEWRTFRGAYDDANMLGGAFEAAAQELRLPHIDVAGATVPHVAAVSRPEGTFERWMSALANKPVVGSLGGNVLRRFRITLDYPNSRAFFKYTPYYGSDRGLAVVAVTITPRDDGTYDIAGVLDHPLYTEVYARLVGAQLVAIDGLPVTGRRISDVHTLLRGIPRSSKHVTVMRDGREESFDVPVVLLWDD